MLEAAEEGRATVVGTNGIVPRRFRVAGREVAGGISCDLAVDRAHRALAPALTLVRAVRAEVGQRFDLIYGFPNAKAEGVLRRSGFLEIGRARRWVKVLRFTRYVEGAAARPELPRAIRWIVERKALAGRAAAVVDVARSLVARVASVPLHRRYDVDVLTQPDARFDELWKQASPEYPVIGDRSVAYIGWRFALTPSMRYVTIRRRGSDRLAGYAAMEVDPGTGAAYVRDFFGHQADLEALLDALVGAAWRAGASSVSLRFLGAPAVARVLRQRGFTRRADTRSVVVAATPELLEGERLTDPDRWYLFDVDEES